MFRKAPLFLSMKKISILGCGWLGLPLARMFLAKGWSVKGSTTTEARLRELSESGIEPFLIVCDPEINGRNLDCFFSSDCLILNIPFLRNLKDPRYYREQILSVAEKAKTSSLKRIIFASSTSVYPDTLIDAREDAVFSPADERAGVLLDIERELLGCSSFSTTVIRFAGLYGANRKIGNFLSGRSVPRANAPVNLIHLDDCCHIIGKLVDADITGEIFNACSDAHPLRKDLYTLAAKALNVPAPQFSSDTPVKGKTVNNRKLKQKLSYTFVHPDPMLDLA